jgi:hypothetical protein
VSRRLNLSSQSSHSCAGPNIKVLKDKGLEFTNSIRAFLWGSFPTDASFPRDLDLFLPMQGGFDQAFRHLPPTQRDVFEHDRARLRFEADVFWATAAIGIAELTAWLSVYQLSRDMVPRGIVEVIWDD